MIGIGGMPVGTGGKAALMLSGGIDSPAAAGYCQKVLNLKEYIFTVIHTQVKGPKIK